jgi:hypothetical protein
MSGLSFVPYSTARKSKPPLTYARNMSLLHQKLKKKVYEVTAAFA